MGPVRENTLSVTIHDFHLGPSHCIKAIHVVVVKLSYLSGLGLRLGWAVVSRSLLDESVHLLNFICKSGVALT